MRIRFSPTGFAELREIITYINSLHPQGAHNVLTHIQSAMSVLKDFPYRGIATDDPTIRRVIALPYPYLIFYEVMEEEVIIRSVRHAARKS